MDDIIRRHTHIVTTQFRTMVTLLILTIILIAGFNAPKVIEQGGINNANRQVEETNHFFSVIAGEEVGRSNQASDKLAVRLHSIVEDGTSADLTDFTARANEYRGINDDLGFNPFDTQGRSCNECGVLTDDMLENLALIEDGKLDAVLRSTANINPGLTLTPFGMPVWAFGLAWWQVVGGIGLYRGLRRYGDRSLTWQRDGVADDLELKSFLMAPLPLTGYWVYNRRKLRRLAVRDREVLTALGAHDDLTEIDRAIQSLKALPSGDYRHDDIQEALAKLQQERDDLLAIPAGMSKAEADQAVAGTLRQAGSVLDNVGIRKEAIRSALSDVQDLDGSQNF
jgi:hypothetical protein